MYLSFAQLELLLMEMWRRLEDNLLNADGMQP
jgi:hypothetical protein